MNLTKAKSIITKPIYFLGFLVLWQALIRVFKVKQFVIPAPTDIFWRIFNPATYSKYNWLKHIGATATEVGLSFLITAIIGVTLAVLIVWFDSARKIIMPIIIFLNSIPKIALAPLFLIWFGFGILPNILIAVLVAFFPVVINTITGLVSIDEDLLDLVRYLNATKWQVFTKIRIPNAMPYIFAGLKVSATMCVTGSIVGEFVATDKGLGYLLRDAQAFIDTPTMFACLLLLSLLGLLLFSLISMLERKIMPWNFGREKQRHEKTKQRHKTGQHLK